MIKKIFSLNKRIGIIFLAGCILLSLYGGFIFFYHKAPQIRLPQSAASQEVSKFYTGQFGILQNATFASESILTVLRFSSQTVQYQVFNENKESRPYKLRSSAINSTHTVDRLDVSGLTPEADFFIQILDEKNNILDARQFRSVNPSQKNAKVAVASCARVGWLGHDFGPVSIWDQLQAQQPDMLLFLGDMIYPDTTIQALLEIIPSPEQIRNKYVEAWNELHLYHQYNLMPVFSVMDDHDYGFQGANFINNKDRRDDMRDLFRTFYPLPDEAAIEGYEKGPGAAFKFSAYGFNYVFLDNKYYRTAAGPIGGSGDIWGATQLEWLTEMLNENGKPTFVASGTLITFPIEQEDAAQYETPEEYARFVKAVRAGKSQVLLLSGDVHFSDVREIKPDVFGYPTYEITASRIHSVSPLVIPPFFDGYVGPEKGQPIHTSEKNFTVLALQEEKGWKDIDVNIHIKDEEAPLTTKIFAEQR